MFACPVANGRISTLTQLNRRRASEVRIKIYLAVFEDNHILDEIGVTRHPDDDPLLASRQFERCGHLADKSSTYVNPCSGRSRELHRAESLRFGRLLCPLARFCR